MFLVREFVFSSHRFFFCVDDFTNHDLLVLTPPLSLLLFFYMDWEGKETRVTITRFFGVGCFDVGLSWVGFGLRWTKAGQDGKGWAVDEVLEKDENKNENENEDLEKERKRNETKRRRNVILFNLTF